MTPDPTIECLKKEKKHLELKIDGLTHEIENLLPEGENDSGLRKARQKAERELEEVKTELEDLGVEPES